MTMVKCILGAVVLLALSVWSDAAGLRHSMTMDDTQPSRDRGAFRRVRKYADPCVQTGCKWPKHKDGKVYVPYKISRSFTPCSHVAIWIAMEALSKSTCIRFVPRNHSVHPDYLNIRLSAFVTMSDVGRRGGPQSFFLREPDTFKLNVVQHELLRSLGLNHQLVESDRDVRVNWASADPYAFENFLQLNALNLETPHEPSSYRPRSRLGDSVNSSVSLEFVSRACDAELSLRAASDLSQSDAERVNHLYCRSTLELLTAALHDLASNLNYDSLLLRFLQATVTEAEVNES